MNRTWSFFINFVIGGAVASPAHHGAHAQSSHQLRSFTDLGADNHHIAERYQKYISKNEHCTYASDVQYRALLGGFGPFKGQGINLSGLVAMNFARLWNEPGSRVEKFDIKAADMHGIIRQDVVEIDGIKVAICAVKTSVMWDLAGAIYLHEANLFKPDLVILSGMDGTHDYVGTWEHHALNQAVQMNGYEHDGGESPVTPVPDSSGHDIKIIPAGPSHIPMKWDGLRLAERTNPVLQKHLKDFSLQTSEEENTGTYLCNNVSYVVLAGLAGYKVTLAGGEIQISASDLSSTQAGFFHYPWLSPKDKPAVRAWVEVMAEAIRVTLFKN